MRATRTWLWLVVALGLALGGKAGLAALGDMVFETERDTAGIPASVFPHWVHRAQYRCYVCHPAIFEMKQGASEITMKKIEKGELCGKCHNGRTAFGSEFGSCGRCHQTPQE